MHARELVTLPFGLDSRIAEMVIVIVPPGWFSYTSAGLLTCEEGLTALLHHYEH